MKKILILALFLPLFGHATEKMVSPARKPASAAVDLKVAQGKIGSGRFITMYLAFAEKGNDVLVNVDYPDGSLAIKNSGDFTPVIDGLCRIGTVQITTVAVGSSSSSAYCFTK